MKNFISNSVSEKEHVSNVANSKNSKSKHKADLLVSFVLL
jgi:hypothetical protein